MSLPSLRKQIDRVDRQLLRLLNRRAALALQVGALKQHRGLPIFDRRREADILRQAAAANRGPLSTRSIRALFQEILRQHRTLEQHTHAHHRVPRS